MKSNICQSIAGYQLQSKRVLRARAGYAAHVPNRTHGRQIGKCKIKHNTACQPAGDVVTPELESALFPFLP